MMVDLASVFAQLLAARTIRDPLLRRRLVASSSYGMPRQTNDIDILADFSGVDLGELSRVLSPDFYADSESMREAVRSGRPFNVIHLKGAFKFDFFPAVPGREFEQSELTRRKQIVSRVPGRSYRVRGGERRGRAPRPNSFGSAKAVRSPNASGTTSEAS